MREENDICWREKPALVVKLQDTFARTESLDDENNYQESAYRFNFGEHKI